MRHADFNLMKNGNRLTLFIYISFHISESTLVSLKDDVYCHQSVFKLSSSNTHSTVYKNSMSISKFKLSIFTTQGIPPM